MRQPSGVDPAGIGAESVVTVRSRGWMLSDEAIDAACALAGDRA